ncbi:MAG: fibronectin type III domain-containing protein, partial [Clostridia bacterium]|nr:fibronectin type III domain-containing protein [Clostridia bacterium]
IKGKGNYSGTMTKNFTIKPKTVTIKSATSPKTKHLKATWKTDSTVTGYQVTYSTNKNFKSGNKSVTVTKKTSSSTTIKNLTKGKTYYVKVRAYKIVNNKKVFGAYSTVKTVKIK